MVKRTLCTEYKNGCATSKKIVILEGTLLLATVEVNIYPYFFCVVFHVLDSVFVSNLLSVFSSAITSDWLQNYIEYP